MINDFVGRCSECCKHSILSKEPLLPTPLSITLNWQKAGKDLFMLGGNTYLLAVDYYSRFPEVIQLRLTTPQNVINAPKAVFARHRIPETLVSDN